MSRGVNHVALLGNVGKSPEMRKLASGTLVANLTLATNEKKKQGEKWVDHTEWHLVVLFGRLAEISEKFLRKGSQVYISGRLRTTTYEDESQTKRWRTNIVAEELVLLNGNGTGPTPVPTET
jgi:single-strand DNA-binding protein